MKRKTVAIVCLILAVLALFSACAPDYAEVDPDTPVNIPDAGLKELITETLQDYHEEAEGDKLTAGDIRKIDRLAMYGTEANGGGNLSSDIQNLSGLEYAINLKGLVIVNNKTSGFNLRPLAGLTNLYDIVLEYNNIGDISPLSGLNKLTSLDLSYNNISDIRPLSGLSNLARLDLSWNKISDISPLSGLTGLDELFLNDNNISDISPLSGLKNLTRLQMVQNNISDVSPLSELINLERLSMSGNNISDVSPLSGLTNLKWLDLGWNNNNISDISPLKWLTKLEVLKLDPYTYDSNQDTIAILEQRGCKVEVD